MKIQLSKTFTLFFILFFAAINAQDISKLQPLDAELSTVKYPFPVHFKAIKISSKN